MAKKPFRHEAERTYLVANNLCWHGAQPGHRCSDFEQKKTGAAKALMPASYKAPCSYVLFLPADDETLSNDACRIYQTVQTVANICVSCDWFPWFHNEVQG